MGRRINACMYLSQRQIFNIQRQTHLVMFNLLTFPVVTSCLVFSALRSHV